MSIKLARKFISAASLILLIFVSVTALLSIGVIIGLEGENPTIVSEALYSFAFSGSSLSSLGAVLSVGNLVEIVLTIGFIGTLLFCWTIYLLNKSRQNSEVISITHTRLNEEIKKRKYTTDILEEVNNELSQSGAKLNTIIESTVDLISAIDNEYRITCFNQAFKNDAKKLFGIDLKIGTNIIDAQNNFPQGQAKSKQLWDQALSGEQFVASEYYVDDQNRPYFYEVTYNPLKSKDGEIIGASHIARNITERKLAEDALKRERDFVSTVVEASNLLVMVTDLEGRVLRFNSACEVASGYKFEEIKGRIFWNVLVSPEEAPEIKLAHRNIKSDDFVKNFVNHWITKDEQSRLISWRTSVKKDEDGVEFLIATGIDITEKEEFKETQNRILDILETSSDFIGISDMNGKVNYLNPAGKDILNVGKSKYLNSFKMISAYPTWAADLIQSEGIPTAIKRGSWIGETALKTTRGRELPVSQLILAHKNDRGEVAYISTIARDISKQKRLETELSTTRDAALETAKLKSEFLANMSHEIRTPMNGIIGLAELLLSTTLDKEQKDYVKSVQSSGEILLTIVNDILDFSKIEAGKLHMETVSFDLRETIESILDLFAEPAHRKGIEIALLVQNSVPDALFGDPRRLRQIITNLVANALKFTDSGEIIIRVRTNEINSETKTSMLHFEVVDTGIGVAESAQEPLFDAFTQADLSITRRYGGTGLGLAISKQLVEMMKGEIGVRSRVNEGATFWFTAQFETEDIDQFSETYSNELNGKRVLIVDDNDSIRSTLMQQTKWLGMVSEEADSKEAASKMLKTAAKNGESFEIAVIDISMSGSDGIALANQINGDPTLRKTRILLMPSVDDHDLIKKAKNAGIDSYLFKPIKQTEFYGHLSDLANSERIENRVKDIIQQDPVVANTVNIESVQSKPTNENAPKILIAEDNLVNQKVISHQIEKLGYDAYLKSNGRQVLEALVNDNYDLILMDCQMPVMDGLQATEEIRKNETDGQRIPIIAITAHAIEGDRERCLEAGMDDYVSKPTKQDELAQVIGRWIPKSKDTTHESLVVKDDEKSSDEAHHIDERLTELADTCGEDVTLECIELFIVDIEESVGRLISAVEVSDMQKIDNEAHKLKGSTANMGARNMPQTCQELMLAARENRQNEIGSLLKTILVEYQALVPIYNERKETYTSLVEELQPTL